MDDTVVILGLVTSLFGILGLELMNHNWFRRERFKADINFEKKEMDMKLKKMARELGLDKKPVSTSEISIPQTGNSTIDTIKSLAPLLAKLAPEQIEGLIEQFLPSASGGGGDDEGSDYGDLLDFVRKNPALVQGLLDKLVGKDGTQSQNSVPNQL